MGYGLALDGFPKYLFSGFKNFSPGEKHIDRICQDDVLLIILEGTLHFTENAIPVRLNRGEYYIQRRGLPQQGDIPSNARYYYIHFSGEFQDAPASLPLRGLVKATPLLQHFEKLDALQLMRRPMVEKSAVFYTILSNLSRGQTDTDHNRIVSKVLTLTWQNMSVPYSLDDLCTMCGYSKNHIINVFKSETGQTPLRYIQTIRLDAAKRMLSYSDMSVSAIAEETGFGSYINFYKTFVKVQGCTPQQWRKEKRLL